MAEIPDDLLGDYILTNSPDPDEAWDPEFVKGLIERIAQLEQQVAEQTETLQRILDWCDAYPRGGIGRRSNRSFTAWWERR